MNAEFVSVLEHWEREKNIPKERLFQAVEESLLAAAKKAVGPARELRVSIDRKSGVTKAWAKLIVAEQVLSKHDQMSIAEARRQGFAEAKVGDEIEVEVTPKDFGRIAAQTARQVLSQALRRIEKETVFDEFKDRIGEIVVGTVRRFERSDVVFELGKAEALMPNRERVPTEDYAIGERVRCFVKAVELTPRGPEVILSRADPQFVIKLFRTEVSEISDGTIEIKGIAREPGFRTKLAVYSRDTKVDPVGACVGIRGQRVKNIVRELNNEKVDIIEWSPDVRRFVENALAPAELLGFEVDEASHRVFARCTPDQLSLAIGRRGQNTRLTERLTGWRISIEADQQRVAGFATQVEHAVQELSVIPGVTPELALALVNAGIHSLEDLVSGAVGDLQELNEVGERAGDLLEAARAELARRKAAPNGTPPTH